MKKLISSLFGIVLIFSTLPAAVFTVEVDGSDQTWRDDGTSIWIGQPGAGIGYDGSQRETAHIMPFALPDLGGETLVSATLTMRFTDSEWGNSLNLDLYGLRVNASAATGFGDFYRGAWDISGTNGTPIQQQYVQKIAGNPAPDNERDVVTDPTGTAALTAWLTSLYSGSASPGDFIFLRLNPDQDYLSGSNSYIYSYTGNSTVTGNISGGTIGVLKPTLTLTTAVPVPEPGSLLLVMVSLIGILFLRNRNHR